MANTDLHDIDTPMPHVLLMAGGFGKRLAPLTENIPKPMLDVAGKPMLEHIVTDLAGFGVKNITISTHFLPNVIMGYFGDGQKWNVSIDYLYEKTPLGTGGALGLLSKDIKQDILMMNGDILCDLDALAFVSSHRSHEAAITIATRQYEFEFPYGVLNLDENNIVEEIVEKPMLSQQISAGIYVVSNASFQRTVSGQKMDMPDFIRDEKDAGEKIMGFGITGDWLDIGRRSDYDKANEIYKNK